METLARLGSVLAILSFILTAAYLFGFFLGLNHIELAYYLTFSDIANYGFGTLCPLTAALILIVVFDNRFKRAVAPDSVALVPNEPGTPKTRMHGILVASVFGGLCGLVGINIPYFMRHAGLMALVSGCIVIIGISIWKLKPIIKSTYGTQAANWMEILLCLFSAAFCYGASNGVWLIENRDTSYTVITDTGIVSTNAIFPLDRGLIAVSGSALKLIPWLNIKSITDQRAAK